MRGKAVYNRIIQLRVGITPAYAGKSYNHIENTAAMKDHPRVCGEKKDNPDEWSEVQGSPPRMRGKEREGKISRTIYGITPAYAGKSQKTFYCQRIAKDHPRVCGEKLACGRFLCQFAGSPPRMRGKGGFSGCFDPGVGITPAYAGKSSGRPLHSYNSWDHPRVCGEKIVELVFSAEHAGSPPRMRGKGGAGACLP